MDSEGSVGHSEPHGPKLFTSSHTSHRFTSQFTSFVKALPRGYFGSLPFRNCPSDHPNPTCISTNQFPNTFHFHALASGTGSRPSYVISASSLTKPSTLIHIIHTTPLMRFDLLHTRSSLNLTSFHHHVLRRTGVLSSPSRTSSLLTHKITRNS